MNRYQLIECISAELQTAMKTYTHDDLSRKVTDTAAIDVLTALREGLRIEAMYQLDALPPGALIRSADGRNFQKLPDANWSWYAPGSATPFPQHMRSTLLAATLLWHPKWGDR